MNGIQEVSGSIPLISTKKRETFGVSLFLCFNTNKRYLRQLWPRAADKSKPKAAGALLRSAALFFAQDIFDNQHQMIDLHRV